MREALIILCSIAAVAALEGIRQLMRWSREKRASELRRRLQSVITPSGHPGATLLRAGKYASSPVLDSALRSMPLASDIERLLEQADSRLTVARFIVFSALAGCAGVTVAAVLALGIPAAVVLGVVGAVVPYLSLVIARTRRSQKISEQLPEALDMMSRSLRAGHAFVSAFEVVASEMPDPISVEFGRAFESQRLGLAVEQAIVQMTERSPGNRDLKIFAVSALIQKETGGNLAEILGSISETIRARYRFYGKLRALTAEGRASGIILGVLPIGMAIVMRILNPPYFNTLISTAQGHVMLAVGIALWLVGVTWLIKLTQVDI